MMTSRNITATVVRHQQVERERGRERERERERDSVRDKT